MTREVFIARSASFLPNAPVGNEEMAQVLGITAHSTQRTRKLVLRQNGIRTRHYAFDPQTGHPTHNNAQLAAQAVRQLFADVERPSIGMLAAGTSLADQIMPGHGVMVHGELGWPACEVASLAGICSAGTAAIKLAYLSIKAGEHDHAVASASEMSSAFARTSADLADDEAAARLFAEHPEMAFGKDFLCWMLSDGAGALWLTHRPVSGYPALRIDWIAMNSQAHEMPPCMYLGAYKDAQGRFTGWLQSTPEEWREYAMLRVTQDVRLLNEHVIHQTLTVPLTALVERHRLRTSDIHWFLPHMSSEYFRGQVREAVGKAGLPIPESRWFTNLSTKGNTGSASIYIILDELAGSGRLQRGERLLCWVPESGRFSSAFFHLTVV